MQNMNQLRCGSEELLQIKWDCGYVLDLALGFFLFFFSLLSLLSLLYFILFLSFFFFLVKDIKSCMSINGKRDNI